MDTYFSESLHKRTRHTPWCVFENKERLTLARGKYQLGCPG
ncbi:MAG: hypothetical protein ACRED0_11805 [Gammaproteobacteria bacterium]